MPSARSRTCLRFSPPGWLFAILLACSGCFTGQGPSAARIRPDTNDRYYPQGEIHFVEHGHRSKGVLVSATPGYDSAFNATWVRKLVPTPPSALDGPVWSGGKVSRDQAVAIASLPAYRNGVYLGLYGGLARFRFRELAVWILSTEPLIVGLPAGEPKRTWREFAVAETGIKDARHASPVDPLVVRFVVQRELDQPLARLAVFPRDFWSKTATGDTSGVELSMVTLPKPLSIAEVLDALTVRDPTCLGSAENVALHEQFASEKAKAQSWLAERERLMAR